MANSYTTRTRLKKPASNDRVWDVPLNANADQLDAVEAIGALAVRTLEAISTTLNVAVEAGPYQKADGTVADYAGTSSFALTASATNRLYLTDAGVLTKDTTGFPAATNLVRLATVVCGATTITSVTPARIPFSSFGAAAAGSYLPLAGGTMSDGANIVSGSTTGLKLLTATTQKLGLWNATPVVQPAGSSDVLASLVTIGARGASSNPPLNLGTGALTVGDVTLADGFSVIVGDVVGTMIGTDPTQLLGFFGASPVVQQSGTADLGDVLLNLGLREAGAYTISGGTPSLPLAGGTMDDGANITVGDVTGTMIGTSPTELLGFFGAWPVAQPLGSDDILVGLAALGLFGATADPSLDMGSGVLTCGAANTGAITTTGAISLGDGFNLIIGTTTGSKIGNVTTAKIGFWNATPVVQTTGATDVLAGLVTIGLRAASANPPLNLGSGALTAGAATLGATTTTTLAPSGAVTIADAQNIILGTTTGNKIGTAVGQKIGFWNATPVIQQASANQAAAAALTSATLTNSTGGTGDLTVADVTASHSQSILNNNFSDLIAQINALRADIVARDTLQTAMRTALVNTGVIKGSA